MKPLAWIILLVAIFSDCLSGLPTDTESLAFSIDRFHMADYLFVKPIKDCGMVAVFPSMSVYPVHYSYGDSVRDNIVGDEKLNSRHRKSSLVRQKRLSANCFVNIVIVPPVSENWQEKFSLLLDNQDNSLTVVDSDFYFFILTHAKSHVDFHKFPHIKYAMSLSRSNSIVTAQVICPISQLLKFVRPGDLLFPDLTRNLHGRILKASLLYPVTGVQMKDISGVWQPQKTGGGILRNFITAAETLNFTYSLQIPRGGGKTGLKSNGTWNGIIGDVVYGWADVGVPVALTPERRSVISVCSAFEYVSIVFSHGPSEPIYSWKSIFLAFSIPIWTGIGISTCAATSIIYLINKAYTCMGQRVSSLRIGEIASYVLCSLIAQYRRFTVLTSHMTFLSAWFAFTIVIGTLFLSNMFKSLTSPPMEPTPRNFHELAQSGYDIGMTYFGGVIYQFFRDGKNGTTSHEIFGKMKKRHYLDCIKDSMKPKHACISYQATIKHIRQVKFTERSGSSPITVRQEAVMELPISFALKKGHPLTTSLSQVASSNYESGLSHYWRKMTTAEIKISSKKSKNGFEYLVNSYSGPKRLNFGPMSGSFSLLVAGFVISLIVFTCEKFRSITLFYRKCFRAPADRDVDLQEKFAGSQQFNNYSTMKQYCQKLLYCVTSTGQMKTISASHFPPSQFNVMPLYSLENYNLSHNPRLK